MVIDDKKKFFGTSFLVPKTILEKKKGANLWYDEITVIELEEAGNVPSKQIRERATKQNPSHNISDALREINELNTTISDEMRERIYRIEDPLKKGNEAKKVASFIELRYHENDVVTDEEFGQWMEDFQEVMSWLNRVRVI